jgi:hypothetical protein
VKPIRNGDGKPDLAHLKIASGISAYKDSDFTGRMGVSPAKIGFKMTYAANIYCCVSFSGAYHVCRSSRNIPSKHEFGEPQPHHVSGA